LNIHGKHELSFVSAILESPDSSEPYLIYADWLEEQGDPRGEFIRVQWELENGSLTASARQDFKRTESQLLKQHSEEWLGDLAPLFLKSPDAPRVRGVAARQFVWQFQRGFVDSLQVSSFPPGFCGLLQASTIPTTLRSLRIRHSGGRGIREDECADLGRTHMPNLREFELTNFFGVEPYRALAGNESLGRVESLTIDPSSSLSDISGLSAFFRNASLNSLTHLALSSAGTDAIVEELTTTDLYWRLERLDLSSGNVTDDGVNLLIEAGVDHLAELNVSLNLLTENGMHLLQAEHQDAVVLPQSRRGESSAFIR